MSSKFTNFLKSNRKPKTFVGVRLQEALESREMSKKGLASLLGVSPTAVGQYEKGLSEPSQDVLEKISIHLNYPIQFFHTPYPENHDEVVFFRSFRSTTITSRKKAKWQVYRCHEVTRFLNNFIEFPPLNLPEFSFSKNYREITNAQIEEAAIKLRRHWGMGYDSAPNLVWLCEKNGIFTSRLPVYDAGIDAFSRWFPNFGTPFIMLASDKMSTSRSRFDIAHELGHILFHKNVKEEELEILSEFKLIEQQANRFASAFLLPEPVFSQDITFHNINFLLKLKTKWKVSLRAIIRRCEDLGLITKDEARILYATSNKRFGAKNEPYEDFIPEENPTLLSGAIKMLLDNDIITKQHFKDRLPFPIEEVAELIGLPRNFFEDDPPVAKVISLIPSGC